MSPAPKGRGGAKRRAPAKGGVPAKSRAPTKGRAPAKGSPSVEYSLLLTATLCLLAFGVVMVFSASSTTSLLGEPGDGAYYLKRTLIFGVAGLLLMRILAVRGVATLRRLTPMILGASFVLCLAVMVPGIGMEVNGSRAWIGAGPIQIQPSELMKIALILFAAHLLTTRPEVLRGGVGALMPVLGVIGAGVVIVGVGDLGTALVICLAVCALLIAAGVRLRDVGLLAAGAGAVVLLAVLIEPYRVARITSFLDPGGDPGGAGFQVTQAKIALGSGGLFGVGLGESLQKAYFLPEAHTDMIAAVIGEELGLIGISALVGLYGMFGYAGLRIAQRARDRYGKLLAAGLTSMVVVQALVNLLAVFGMAPLTGVPLPFVSYGNASMLVMLAAVGLLLNIARGGSIGSAARPAAGGGRLRVVDEGRGVARAQRAPAPPSRSTRVVKGRHSRGGNGGTRGPGAGRRRRASR
jgi:cell division protein FtsW